MHFLVNLHLKPTKIQLLSGVADFKVSSILDKQKFSDWVYKEPLFIDPTQFSSYQDEKREQLRKDSSFSNSDISFSNSLYSIDNLRIETDTDKKVLHKEKDHLDEYPEIACFIDEDCELIKVSFLLDVYLDEGMHRLVKNYFTVPANWLIGVDDNFPAIDYLLREEHYQELISREEKLIGYGNSITNKGLFLKIMSPALYEKYALLRD